eukprot:15283182-Alexandrium_andersonii.AAC.1
MPTGGRPPSPPAAIVPRESGPETHGVQAKRSGQDPLWLRSSIGAAPNVKQLSSGTGFCEIALNCFLQF